MKREKNQSPKRRRVKVQREEKIWSEASLIRSEEGARDIPN